MTLLFGALALASSAGLPTSAEAQEPQLQYAQSGALLAFADAEAVILHGALLAKEFDPELATGLLGDLERALLDAKRMVDRTQILLSDEKLDGDFKKLLDILRRGEAQLVKLKSDFEQETQRAEPAPSDHAEDAEPESPKQRNWGLLKTGLGWLYADIKDARAQHSALGKKIPGAPLKPPPRPAGKR